jgi:hypothetical protein
MVPELKILGKTGEIVKEQRQENMSEECINIDDTGQISMSCPLEIIFKFAPPS